MKKWSLAILARTWQIREDITVSQGNNFQLLEKSKEDYPSFLYGEKFLIRTDLSALQQFLNFKSPDAQIALWIEKGKSHGNTDSLSRRSCSPKEFCKRQGSKDGLIKQIVSCGTNGNHENCFSRNRHMLEQISDQRLAIVREQLQNGIATRFAGTW